ncbi:MAG: PKD domain-containing protein [Desulfobulbus sp.]|jgi:PKD repeat protein
MQRSILFLLVIFCCWLPAAALAETRSIHVEWGYTPPNTPAVTGFKLYQEGIPVCQTNNPQAHAMDCQVTLTSISTFTLTATFDNGTESPHSAPVAFNTEADTATAPSDQETDPGQEQEPVETTPTTPVPDVSTPPEANATGSKLFTFSWEPSADPTTLKGYKVYLNGSQLCETAIPGARSLSCRADLLHEVMTFSLTQVDTDGNESTPSNLLVFDPTAHPELYTAKDMHFTWDYTGPANISGFRIHQNGREVCTTTDPAARQLTCTVDLINIPATYAISAINPDGTATSLSNLITYNTAPGASSPTEPGLLKAIIAATPPNGPAPLAVAFDATGSTGSPTSIHWDFGDGSTATGSKVNHSYASAGVYTAKLTVTNSYGQSDSATTQVTVAGISATATPPTVVLATSTAAGPAPLAVTFDASGSTAADKATITNYSWSFGDGASATGSSVVHAFTSPGTYTTTVTVTDSNGAKSTTSTPVVVTAATSADNAAPTARINVTPNSGTAPLTVTFDASGSTDSDGSIAAYTWNFGDGSTATGPKVTHTYTTAASFTATLQVKDNLGAEGSAVATITVAPQATQESALNIEAGEIAVTGDWVRVSLSTPFDNPIVVAGPATYNDAEPGVIRVRNVTRTGFDIKFGEWDYLDQQHPAETVRYLVMNKGRAVLPNGSVVEAGSFSGSTQLAPVAFSKKFATAPVVLTTVASNNTTRAISGRVDKVTDTGFTYLFREQEKNKGTHANETIHFIAWEPGQGTVGSLQFEAGTTPNEVTHAWFKTNFTTKAGSMPMVLADLQTRNDNDTAALRIQQVSPSGFEVKVEEEQSRDQETSHSAETVGYLMLSQKDENSVLSTFTWEFETEKEGDISGFQILANGTPVCSTSDPKARSMECTILRPTSATGFSVQAIDLAGTGIGNASNTMTYRP